MDLRRGDELVKVSSFQARDGMPGGVTHSSRKSEPHSVDAGPGDLHARRVAPAGEVRRPRTGPLSAHIDLVKGPNGFYAAMAQAGRTGSGTARHNA